MGKSKHKQLVEKPASKKNTRNDSDFEGEDGWVIVKKQRVTILIPPLPHARKITMLKPGQSKQEGMPVKTMTDKLTVPVETCTRVPSVDEQEKVTPFARNRGTEMNTITPALNLSTSHKPPRVNVTIESKNPDRGCGFKSHKILGVSSASKTFRRSRLLHGPGNFFDGQIVLNRMLRASLLEKKLQKAGGLSRWLASLGLGQFASIFKGETVGKFQLVNLTMKKLKDMGADAVGPRRKLMHAIDCICQPYCFETH